MTMFEHPSQAVVMKLSDGETAQRWLALPAQSYLWGLGIKICVVDLRTNGQTSGKDVTMQAVSLPRCSHAVTAAKEFFGPTTSRMSRRR